MTNYEYLKSTTFEKAAKALCEIMQDIDPDDVSHVCKLCPVEHHCYPGHNGFIDWLKEER